MIPLEVLVDGWILLVSGLDTLGWSDGGSSVPLPLLLPDSLSQSSSSHGGVGCTGVVTPFATGGYSSGTCC